MTKAQIQALAKRIGTTQLARDLGVAPSTVRRWKAGTQVPKAEALQKLQSYREGARQATKERPSELLGLPPETLARLGGVTLRTARKWLREGISPRGLQSIRSRQVTDQREGIQRPKRKGKAQVSRFVGKTVRGLHFRLRFSDGSPEDPGEEISDWVVGKILFWVRDQKLPEWTVPTNVQVVCDVLVPEQMTQLQPKLYGQIVQPLEPETDESFEMVSTVVSVSGHTHKEGRRMTSARAVQLGFLEELGQALDEVSQHGATVRTVHLYQRRAL